MTNQKKRRNAVTFQTLLHLKTPVKDCELSQHQSKSINLIFQNYENKSY